MTDYTKKLWATMTVPCPDDRSPEDWLKEWVFKAIEQAIKDTQEACAEAVRSSAFYGDVSDTTKRTIYLIIRNAYPEVKDD